MKAVNLFAGTGTLTRAFQNQGVEVIWAQGESEDEARIHRCNFPDIPFYLGELSHAADKIPSHDILLASLSCGPFSISVNRAYQDKSREQLYFVDSLLSKHQPRAVCFMFPAFQMLAHNNEILELVKQNNYQYSYRILEKGRDGGVPVQGKKGYLIGIREGASSYEFEFPEPCHSVRTIEELWRAEEQKDVYYRIPRRYEELLAQQELKRGKIYKIVSHRTEQGPQFELRECTVCPALTPRSYRETFVRDSRGVRNLTEKEYLLLSGDKETMFPDKMSRSRILKALNKAGIYAVEKRLAPQLLEALRKKPEEMQEDKPENSLQRKLAAHLLQPFEWFLYEKKTGLLCMPSGLGKSEVLSLLVQGMRAETEGAWKIIILSAYAGSGCQIRESLASKQIQARLAESVQEIYRFLFNEEQVFITSYIRWSNFIKEIHPKDFRANLILIGMDVEDGWKQLKETGKYLPQIIYAGITSVENSGAEEIFGPVRYSYTLAQAIREQQLLPVSIEGEAWEQEEEKEQKASVPGIRENALADWLWKDLALYRGKTVIIAESVKQAEELYQELTRRSRGQEAESQMYLCHSLQASREREKHLDGFHTSASGRLITVNMWRMLLDPDIRQIYVLGKQEGNSLHFILSLAAKKFPGKNSGRLVLLEQNLREEARTLLELEEEAGELQAFCSCILEEQYEKAKESFQKLSIQAKQLAGQIKKELEALTGLREQKTALSGKSLARLWLLLSKAASPFEGLKKYTLAEAAEKEPANEADGEEAFQEESSIPVGKEEKLYKSSAEKGQVLEQAFLSLLSHLFTWEMADTPKETSADLEYIQKKPGGIQNGRDLDLVYSDETGQKRRCYFECKSVESRALREGDIVPKIWEAQRSAKEEIEHWVLIAPNCRLDSYSVELFEEEAHKHRFYPPIKDIQVWNSENQIQELMGLEPELYERFFGKAARPKEDPAGWSEDKKWRIIQKWKRKLMPVLMLPKGLTSYPFEPERLMFDLQNDPAIRRQYEELFLRRTKLKFYEENGTLSQEYLEEDMLRWLKGGGPRVRAVLGEFGDGKTFFLYCLCRRLLEEFVKNPQENYLPVCISLKGLERTKDPKAFIEQRMKELSCDYADFLELKKKFHVLMCLDGFDEISSVIDRKTVSQNIRLLNECIELMTEAKVLITSRTQCFEQNDVKQWLDERVGGLEALSLAPVEAEDREEFLMSGISEEKRIERQEQLLVDKKLFGLMGKPFFLDMMGQLLASGEWSIRSSVSIYDRYVRECLNRKFDRSFLYKEEILFNKKETVDRICEALSAMAYALWQNGQETLSVREFETHLGRSAAEVLWKEKNPDENEREDADHRFSMRTLFQYAGDSRVKFSHRSIQEYFVAVYLQQVLQRDSRDFEALFRKCYFNDEILRFLSELITEDKTRFEEVRQKLIHMAEDAGSERGQAVRGKSLAGKIMQMFYFIDKRIPKADWQEKNLSGVDIPGADLSGQSLRGSWFHNANLNNVCLNDSDCSYCDMTGVRLEETCPICAIRYERGKLHCLYQDGSMRRWEVRRQEEISHLFPVPLLENAFFGEQGEIFTQSGSMLRVIEVQNGEAFVRQEYKKQRERSLLCVQGQLALVKDRHKEHTSILMIHMEDYRIVKEWSVKEEGSGTLTGGKLAVISDGRGRIELFSAETCEDVGVFALELPGNLITLDALAQGDGVELAAGCSSGEIFVYRYRQGAASLLAQGRQQGLKYTALCENQSLAAVDGEGAVHLMHWEEGSRQLRREPAETMKLGIYCRNIKTHGLIPETVEKRLRERA